MKTGETDEGWYTVKDPNTTIGEKYATDNDTLKPEFLKDKDGKTYQLTAKEVRADSDPKDGSVKADTQYIIYEYKLISGGAVRVKYFIEGTDTELDNPEAGDRVKTGETDEGWYTVKDPNTTIGEKYATDNDTLKPEFLKDKDGKTYQLTAKEVRADSDPKDGSVKADTQYIIYEYKLISGGAVRVKYFIEGTDTELDNPEAGDRVKTGETDEGWYTVKDPNTTIGEKYATDNDTLKPEYLKDKDGKLYKLTAKEVRADSDPKDGSVKADTQYIIYEYKLVEETPKTPEKPHNDEPKNNTPKLEEKKTTTPTPKTKQTKSKAVKTGDDTVLWIYVLLAGISILGGILVLKRNKATR